MTGWLNFDKPIGMSSGDAVYFVRKRLLRGVKVGHGGTLDPGACGVLAIGIGSAVRLFDYMRTGTKVYRARMTLGVSTDTQDASGKVISEFSGILPGEAAVRAVLARFVGEIMQIPPMYSALHVNGKRLYDIARAGGSVDVPPRKVTIISIEYAAQTAPNEHEIRVECLGGTYIRTLLHDIGHALGCGAHMSYLKREAVGGFTINTAVPPDMLTNDTISEHLLKADVAVMHLLRVDLPGDMRAACLNGSAFVRHIPEIAIGSPVRVYVGGAFAGIGVMGENGIVKFAAMLLDGGTLS